MVSARKLFFVASFCFAVAGASVLKPTPAVAQFGLPGIGGNPARILNGAARALNPGSPSYRGSSSRRSRGSSEENSDETSSRKNAKADPEATARIAKQLAAIEAELVEISRAEHMERERNIDTAVKDFIKSLADGHERLLKQPDRGVRATRGEINQVTAGQVKSAVEDAYDKANLRDFEKYTGELWTRDRLLVRILRSATKGLNPYFEGVGAKGPAMDDLKDLFQRSARGVFSKALETAEVIGVSKSFDRFIRTIYEQSDGANESLWTTGADAKYERLTSLTIDAFWQRDATDKEPAAIVADTQGLERQFLYRFRARRALYECLSMTYPELVRGGGTITAGQTTTTVAPGQRTALRPIGPTMTPAKEAALWVKVGGHVVKTCQGMMPTILAKAKGGMIGPLSSRESGLPTGALPVGERQ